MLWRRDWQAKAKMSQMIMMIGMKMMIMMIGMVMMIMMQGSL